MCSGCVHGGRLPDPTVHSLKRVQTCTHVVDRGLPQFADLALA
jgi:hypothetical protein